MKKFINNFMVINHTFNLRMMQKFFCVAKNVIFGYPLLDQDQGPSFSDTIMNLQLNNSIEFTCI
jgi:hypothetical protein